MPPPSWKFQVSSIFIDELASVPFNLVVIGIFNFSFPIDFIGRQWGVQ